MAWNPDRYLRYADLRTRPAVELLTRVPVESPATVVDLGCGPGNSTRLLANRWPTASIVGLDSSIEMCARARTDHPDLTFVEGDIAHWEPDGPVDVIFSNAALQWIPDHLALLPRLLGFVAPGGSLAVQVPNNYDRPAHSEGHRIVRTEFPELDGILPDRRRFDPVAHYDALAGPGISLDIWETTYAQVLTGDHPVVDWTSGTFLRPLLVALDGDPRRDRFLELYTQAMAVAYPRRADGATVFAFPRLFVVATKVG
jgi:trans-aconitate 2-methyltransferase